jgi:hypothetical protein
LSLIDVACNLTGLSIGTVAAWRFRKIGLRIGQPALPPVLLLACWICYHLYPLVPMVLFSRMRFEWMLWLHSPRVSLI